MHGAAYGRPMISSIWLPKFWSGYHSTKTAKIFWVTLDVAMHGAAYGRPMISSIWLSKFLAVLVE